jgi:peptidoglycan/LPS O-acetylase OafA/YrhL
LQALPKRDERIPGLDGFRAIAIVLVILAHLRDTLPEFHDRWRVFHSGNLGVMIFFVISGYLITRLMLNEHEKTGRVSLKAFYLRRAFRIFPALYTYYFTIVILALAGIFVMWEKTLINAAFFVTNYKHYWTPDDGPNYWLVGHFWTLSLEEQFYLFWPAVFCLFKRKRALVTAVVLIASIQVLRGISYYFDASSRGQIDMMLHTSLDSIMMGCLLALMESTPRFRRVIDFLASHWMAALAVLYFLIPAFSGVLLGAQNRIYVATLGRLISFFWISVLVIWGTRSENTWAGRALNFRPVVFVGTLSYSLYLWQQLFLGPVNTSWFGRFPQNLGCAFVAALLSYYCVEQPFLRLRKRWVKVSAARTSPPSKPAREAMLKT